MIIDLILDRKDNLSEGFTDDYNAHNFYMECMGYNNIFDGIADGITRAMDGGTETDVKRELCKYITNNGYNTEICDFINSVKWLQDFRSTKKALVKACYIPNYNNIEFTMICDL